MKNLSFIFLVFLMTFFELNISCDESKTDHCDTQLEKHQKPGNREICVPVKYAETDIFYLFFIMKNSKNPNIFISRKNLKSEFERIEKEIVTLILTQYMNDFRSLLKQHDKRRFNLEATKRYISFWINDHLNEIEKNYRTEYLKLKDLYNEPSVDTYIEPKDIDPEENPELDNCLKPRKAIPRYPVNI